MDFSWIGDFFNNIQLFFQDIWQFVYSGIYDFVKEAFVVVTKLMIYAYFQSLIFCIDIAHDVVQDLLAETGVTQHVQQAYSNIPADIRQMLAFFNIPQGLTLIFSAIPTRWAMKFIPFIGR